ncbi:MAG: alkane 1-monooxygenase [Saprospiraceae bacterium]|nr:alkane 1-monooxygenase [Saprospiraceae bacterium]
MKFSDLRYLSAYLIPVSCFAGLYFGGWASPGALYLGFVIVPLIEFFVPAVPNKEEEAVLQIKSKIPLFDHLLYLNVPALYFNVGYFVWILGLGELTTFEIIFSVLNVGVLLGVSGINVAHELGHRENLFDQWMARLLLLPALYSHFTLEHNYGHHLRVGTHEDPATARKNEPVYKFYYRSIVQGYLNAWEIGTRRRMAAGRPAWMHEVLLGHFPQIVLLIFVGNLAGWWSLIPYISAALIGIISLESVNYIEHYGLLRKKLASGRVEPMTESHSWNSNHELGRIMLFELVRHADHHYQTTRKYQTLRHFEKSPQLPFGYPMSIILALIPPLWFRIMNPRVEMLQRD